MGPSQQLRERIGGEPPSITVSLASPASGISYTNNRPSLSPPVSKQVRELGGQRLEMEDAGTLGGAVGGGVGWDGAGEENVGRVGVGRVG